MKIINLKEHRDKKTNINDIVPIMQSMLLMENERGIYEELFWCVGLANDNTTLYIDSLNPNTSGGTTVTISEILQMAFIKSAVKLILVRSDPKGNLSPSPEDKDLTDKLIQAAKLLNKEIVDYIIISVNNYYSFVEKGLFKEFKK